MKRRDFLMTAPFALVPLAPVAAQEEVALLPVENPKNLPVLRFLEGDTIDMGIFANSPLVASGLTGCPCCKGVHQAVATVWLKKEHAMIKSRYCAFYGECEVRLTVKIMDGKFRTMGNDWVTIQATPNSLPLRAKTTISALTEDVKKFCAAQNLEVALKV